jgi:HTH-type transcriptional regulator / antitoxin HigA
VEENPMSKPAEVFHPGEFIMDEMDSHEWTIDRVAERMCVDRDTVLGLICGITNVDEDMARKLSFAFRTSAEYWLNLQKAYDERNK